MLKIQIYDPWEELKLQRLFLDSKAFSPPSCPLQAICIKREKKKVHSFLSLQSFAETRECVSCFRWEAHNIYEVFLWGLRHSFI